MSMNTLPPACREPEKWLEWLADQPYFTAAIDTAKEAGMDDRIIAYAVGGWIADHRQDELAARIASEFLRLQEVLAR